MKTISKHRGYEIRELENGSFNGFKDGYKVSWRDFNTAWSVVCYIDELLSP